MDKPRWGNSSSVKLSFRGAPWVCKSQAVPAAGRHQPLARQGGTVGTPGLQRSLVAVGPPGSRRFLTQAEVKSYHSVPSGTTPPPTRPQPCSRDRSRNGQAQTLGLWDHIGGRSPPLLEEMASNYLEGWFGFMGGGNVFSAEGMPSVKLWVGNIESNQSVWSRVWCV